MSFNEDQMNIRPMRLLDLTSQEKELRCFVECFANQVEARFQLTSEQRAIVIRHAHDAVALAVGCEIEWPPRSPSP